MVLCLFALQNYIHKCCYIGYIQRAVVVNVGAIGFVACVIAQYNIKSL